MSKAAATFALAFSAMLLSCGDKADSLLPQSGGSPYEVVVASDDEACADITDSLLSQADECLPQDEPMFDVSKTSQRRFGQTAKLARNIVIVTADSSQFTRTRIRYEKNAWAKPQMVVYITTPSAERLRHDMASSGGKITQLLTRAEMNAAISELKAEDNVKAEKSAAKTFGVSISIPKDMTSSKQGRDFLWLSNNAATGMRNICIYRYAGTKLDAGRAVAVRDSIMKANIPGERRGMYMQTSANSVRTGMERVKGRDIMVTRGLWEMHGDAMGGPFVAHSLVDSAKGMIVVAEAFVYAPERKKRNLTRSTEAALYTLEPAKAKSKGKTRRP